MQSQTEQIAKATTLDGGTERAEPDRMEKRLGSDGSEVILVIGNVRDWLRSGRVLPEDPAFSYRDHDSLDAHCLDALAPGIVLCPLVGTGFDALDIAARLNALGYGGRFRVLAPKLPHPRVVLAEIRAQAPDVDCDLFQVANPQKLRII